MLIITTYEWVNVGWSSARDKNQDIQDLFCTSVYTCGWYMGFHSTHTQGKQPLISEEVFPDLES